MMPEFLTESDAIAATFGLTRDRLASFMAAEVVIPLPTDTGPAFRSIDLARLRLLCELSDDLDLDDTALSIVMSLIDQLHGARSALQAIVLALAAEPDVVRIRIGAAVQRFSA